MLFSAAVVNAAAPSPESPTATVNVYCTEGAKGRSVEKYLTEEMHGGGDDSIVVISTFSVEGEILRGERSFVVVQFEEVGTAEACLFKPSRRNELVTFELLRVNGDWKIVENGLPMRWSKVQAMSHFQKMAEEQPEHRECWLKSADDVSRIR